MTYGQTVTRFDFDTVTAIAATQRQADRRKLRRLRKAKRALHFIGFLSYWAIFTGICWLLILAAAVVCLRLT